MASAAATPTAMPSSLARPSGIVESDWARKTSRAGALAGCRATRARWAAATAAASGDAPGGAAMVLHSDQGYTPRSIALPLTMNVMWMLDDFTDANGATRLVPGSHRRTEEPPRDRVETVPGVGPAGTALVFDGRIWHGTGANTTAGEKRHGVLTYFCRPWLRPQETHLLAVPPEVVRTLPERLQELLGYNIYPPFLGYVDGRHPRRVLDREASRAPDVLRTIEEPPEHAPGRTEWGHERR